MKARIKINIFKYCIILILALFSFLVIKVNVFASTWKYVWENTVIHVPLYDEIKLYEDIPKATLYRDNEKLDANIVYLKEGDWLHFLKDVNTSKTGTYYVWYKAFEYDKYFPGTCNGYKALITFIVEDKTPPNIKIYLNEINERRIIKHDEKRLNEILNNNVSVLDNYSQVEISFIHNIDLSVVGRYKVFVFASDQDNNINSNEFFLNIFDDNYPIIYFNAPNDYLKIAKNAEIDIKSYFQAVDEVDGDISERIIYPEIDLSKTGKKEIEVIVKNSGGNITKKNVVIEVVDDVAPIIELVSNFITLDYLIDIESLNLVKYISKIEDDEIINYDNLTISHNLENKVGNYQIFYNYNDGVNETNEILDVKMISFNGPTIIVNEVVINEGEYVNLNDFIEVTDPSDNNVLSTLTINDDSVNYEKEGIYYAGVYAINSSGMSTTKKIRIIVNKKNNNLMTIIIILCVFLSLLLAVLATLFGMYIYKKYKSKKNIDI